MYAKHANTTGDLEACPPRKITLSACMRMNQAEDILLYPCMQLAIYKAIHNNSVTENIIITLKSYAIITWFTSCRT